MQEIKLNIVPGGVIPVLHATQYDVGRELKFLIFDGNSPASLTGTTATIEGTKPDGNGFSYECTISNNEVTVETTAQMTVLSGSIDCKITFFKESDRIGTALFILDIEKAALNSDTPISETEIPSIIALAREQEQNAEAWAVGTKNGEPVSEDDPQYENSSKWWAEYAESAVTGVTGVKGNAESTYRQGNVNLTPANLGAIATNGDVSNTKVPNFGSEPMTPRSYSIKTDQGFTGVNLIRPLDYVDGTSKTTNGITFTVDTSGTITANGTATAQAEFHISNRANESYISRNMTVGSSYILEGIDSDSNLGRISIGNTVSGAWHTLAELTKDSSNHYVSFTYSSAGEAYITVAVVIPSGVTVTNAEFRPCLAIKTTTNTSALGRFVSGRPLHELFAFIASLFSNVRKLWNTVGSTALDTAYGATLTAQMANLKSYNTYSTSETWTGKYWIDGKKIYSKIIEYNTYHAKSNTLQDVKIGTINNVDRIIRLDALNDATANKTGSYSVNWVVANPSQSISLYFDAETSKLHLCFINISINDFKAIVEYTKTT